MPNLLRPRVDVTETLQQLVTPGENTVTIGISAPCNSEVSIDEFVLFTSLDEIENFYGANAKNTTRGNNLYELAKLAFSEGASRVKLCNMGATATPTKTETLGAAAEAGDVELTVADATEYTVGDVVYIGTGNEGFAYEEVRVLTSATGTKIGFTTPLQFDHGTSETVSAVPKLIASDFTTPLTNLVKDRDVQIFIASTDDTSIQSTIKTSILSAQEDENFMIYLTGLGFDKVASDAITQAGLLNHALATLVFPNITDSVGKYRFGYETASMVAGAITRRGVPNMNFNLLELTTATGVVAGINDIDALIGGGVLPIEIRDNEVQVVRAVTTSDDELEEELSIRLNVNHIERTIQRTIEKTYLTSGNTLETREAIKTTVTELLRTFNDTGILSEDERTGTPGYKTPIVKAHPTNRKRVDVTIEIAPTQPLVWITLHFNINL